MTEIFDCFDVCFFQIVNALDLACHEPLMKTLQIDFFSSHMIAKEMVHLEHKVCELVCIKQINSETS